jgi:hypothetical protein
MAINSIMAMGIGFLFASLIALAVMPLVHGRAERLTKRRLEDALPQSMAEIQADKDLLRAEFAMAVRRLEIIVEQLRARSASQLVELGKKQDVVNRLKIERDTLKIEAIALKTQVEAAACSTKPADQARLMLVEPAISQSMQEVLQTRKKNGAGQLMQTDTWTRDINVASIVPATDQFRQDTWAREELSSDLPVGPTIKQPVQEDTWERTGKSLRAESKRALVSTWEAPMPAFGARANSRARRREACADLRQAKRGSGKGYRE